MMAIVSKPITITMSITISSITIVAIVSISSGLSSGLSLPLSKMAVSTITISMVRIVTIAVGRVVSVAITKMSIAISIVGISRGFSYCSGLSVPLSNMAISTVAITMIWVVTIGIGRVVSVAITKVSIAISIVG